VSVGSLYEYFPNKDALLFALGEKHLSDVEMELAPWLDSERSREPKALLRGLFSAILDLHRRYPGMHDTLARVAAAEPQLAERARALEAQAVDVLAKSLEPRLEVGAARARARVVISSVGHLTHELIVTERDPEVAEQLERASERMCLSLLSD